MDQTRREFLLRIRLLALAPIAVTASPTLGSCAPSSAKEAPIKLAKWTRSRSVSALPKIVRTPTDLTAARLVLPIRRDSIRGKHAEKLLAYRAGVWPGLADFSGDVEGAIVNDSTALWLAGGESKNMLIWAESHSALPNHWINPATNRLWSIQEDPHVSTYSKTRSFDSESDSRIQMDSAHYPSICYVPYLATGDLFYLEELQFAANYHQLKQNPVYRKYDKGLFTKGQARAWAWSLRDTAAAYLATPDGEVPAPLLPKSYWKHILDNNRDDFAAVWRSPQNPLAGCHFARMLYNGKIAPWQQDWIGAVMGWMVWTGRFDDWRENYEWHIRQAIDRTSGKSGYPRSRAIQYWPTTAGVTNMASFAAANNLVETPDGKFPPKTNMHYAASLRANLKIAVLNRIPEAAECFDYVDRQVTSIVPRWAV